MEDNKRCRAYSAIFSSLFLVAIACASPSSSERADQARKMKQINNIYTILNEYPALESLFINNNLSRNEFERKFFSEYLNNQENAWNTLQVCHAFPLFFEPRTVPSGIFLPDLQARMEDQGAMHDMLEVTSDILLNLSELPAADKQAVYAFFDGLTAGDASNPIFMEILTLLNEAIRYASGPNNSSGGIIDSFSATLFGGGANESPSDIDQAAKIFRDSLYNSVVALTGEDEKKVDDFMGDAISALQGMKNIQKGRLDFNDIDVYLNNYGDKLPGQIDSLMGLLGNDAIIDLLDSSKDMFGESEVKGAVKNLMLGLGGFLNIPQVNELVKDALKKIHADYNTPVTTKHKEALKSLFSRLWSEGPRVGGMVKEIGYPGYGKDGGQKLTLKHLLMQPQLVSSICVWLHRVKDVMTFDGKRVDMLKTDEAINDLINHDPMIQPRNPGNPYKPKTNDGSSFSYKNVSYLRGISKLAARFSQPLVPTSPLLYEKDGLMTGAQAKKLIRTVMPDADRIPLASFLWAEVYKTTDPINLGKGKVKKTKDANEYGMLVDGVDETGKPSKVLIAPLCPEILTGAELAFFVGADCMYNGPYNNPYDNVDWLFNSRKYYVVMDLVQLLPLFKIEIPDNLHFINWLFELFGLKSKNDSQVKFGEWLAKIMRHFGIKSLPIKIWETYGANSVVYIEAGQLMSEMPQAITNGLIKADFIKNSTILKFMTEQIIKMIDYIAPIGYKNEKTGKVYLLPQDLRDLWPTLSSLSYFDPAAFHLDRLADGPNHKDYYKCYDTTDKTKYRFIVNGQVNPKVNKMSALAGAFCLSMYEPYMALMKRSDLSFSRINTEERPYYQIIADRQNAARSAFNGAVFPMTFLINILSSLTEASTEEYLYSTGDDRQMAFLKSIEPLLSQQSQGVIDSLLTIAAKLGSDEMAGYRAQITEGLAAMAAQSSAADSSSIADTLLAFVNTASAQTPMGPNIDSTYWDYIDVAFELGGRIFKKEGFANTVSGILDPANNVMDDIMGLVHTINDRNYTQDEINAATRGIALLLKKSAEDRAFARGLTDTTDILAQLHTIHPWSKILSMSRAGYCENGVTSYVFLGIEKNNKYCWDEIFSDAHRFLKSDVMARYDEDSFWDDMYHLVKFMADAF